MRADYDKDEIKALMKELENKDLKEFVEGIAKKQDNLNQNGANNILLNPLLLAAEYGCHKILKQIVKLGDGIKEYEQMSASIGFKFSDCNKNGDNFLLLGSFD